YVVHLEFPALGWLVEPGKKALALFLLGDVQKEFHDQHAVACEMLLEMPDAFEALVPDILAHEIMRQPLAPENFRMHTGHQHILIVRAIENADPPALRKCFGDAPKKIVIELFGARRLERVHLATLWIDARHHVLDRAVLAGRIHRLEYDQH